MSDAKLQLAQSRQAILDHINRGNRRQERRESARSGDSSESNARRPEARGVEDAERQRPRSSSGGLLGRVRNAFRAWWRYHPARAAVDIAAPLVHDYAQRKPAQLLAISLAAGAAVTIARPWRLLSVTLVLALLKSSQLSSVLLAAMSAADYEKDHQNPS